MLQINDTCTLKPQFNNQLKSLKIFFSFFSGYAFLLFQEEISVQALIDACIEEDGKLYLCVSSPTIKDKPVSEGYLTQLNLRGTIQ